jgi:hypothetical protein
MTTHYPRSRRAPTTPSSNPQRNRPARRTCRSCNSWKPHHKNEGRCQHLYDDEENLRSANDPSCLMFVNRKGK